MNEDHPDPAFPRLHPRPARGWVNDPNGCSYIDGRYHLFFQHNPHGPVHDAIHWGHVSSPDLVHWQPEPIALTPRPSEPDEYGCWSGCVVDDAGIPTAVYSAVRSDTGASQVLLARSDRHMRSWRQDRTPVVGMPDAPTITDVRDPFVFTFDGHRYAIQGAGHRQEHRPKILVYGCDDLTAWTELGALYTWEDPLADIAPASVWECPNLVDIDGNWVLIVSLWRRVGEIAEFDGVRYLIGDLAGGPEGLRFTPTSGGQLDRGPSFYAPQVLQHGRRALMWGWSWEHGRTPAQIHQAGWAGALTFPRDLSIINGTLVAQPAPELSGMRRQDLGVVSGEPFRAPAFDVQLGSGAGRVSLSLVEGGDERLVAEWDVQRPPLVPPRVLVDGSMIEIFDGGAVATTTRAYPTAASSWVLRAGSSVTLRAWQLELSANAAVPRVTRSA